MKCPSKKIYKTDRGEVRYQVGVKVQPFAYLTGHFAYQSLTGNLASRSLSGRLFAESLTLTLGADQQPVYHGETGLKAPHRARRTLRAPAPGARARRRSGLGARRLWGRIDDGFLYQTASPARRQDRARPHH